MQAGAGRRQMHEAPCAFLSYKKDLATLKRESVFFIRQKIICLLAQAVKNCFAIVLGAAKCASPL